jgi:hypothetical protein
MGPIRMPARVMFIVSLTAILLLAVLLERTLDARPRRFRVALSLLWVALASAGAALVYPDSALLQFGAGAVVVAGVLMSAWAARRPSSLAVVMIVVSVGVAMFQFTVQPEGVGGQRGSPGSLATYADLLPGAQGDVLVIGLDPDVLAEFPGLGQSLLPGSLWDLSGKPVHNGYTTLGFRDYNDRFCVRYNGDVCPAALDAMLETEPVTGLPWVDLHSISTLVLVNLPADRMQDPPPGWRVAHREDHVVTWVRDQVLPTAGGVVWTSPGTRVHPLGQTPTSTTFRVEQVANDDASVVLSRIAWPGYRVDGADFADPLGGHLLRVGLSPDDEGATVTISFRPPGWDLEIASLVAALLLGLGWSVLVWTRREQPPGNAATCEGVWIRTAPPTSSARSSRAS